MSEMKYESAQLPEIGDVVTTVAAWTLCRYFGLGYIVERIEADPGKYKSWKFDGCSGLPDRVMGLLTGCRWKDITYKCCLPHDLCYAYGELGNKIEKKKVDLEFYNALVNRAGMKKWKASVFHAAVRVGGCERLKRSFSWGFAQ